MQVPSCCPARFHPPSTPTLPRQPRLLSTNQGTGGRRHSGDTSKRSLGERLRADAGTTQRSTEESRDGQLGEGAWWWWWFGGGVWWVGGWGVGVKKRSPNGMEKKGVQAEQNISFSSQTSIMPAVHPKKPRHIFLTALSQWPP